MITPNPYPDWKQFSTVFFLFCFIAVLLQCGCQPKTAEATGSADSLTQADIPRDSIVSFEALFAPDKYSEFLYKYWMTECNSRRYEISKAANRNLPCECSDILPTIENNNLAISLNNINCFPPEMEEEGYHLEHYISVPLEDLRPYLTEAGTRIVFESKPYLQEWLAARKKEATTVAPSSYTLYMSVIAEGKGFRIVLQSREGKNNEETISGYFEDDDGKKTEVVGYRTWGGFVIYDRTKDASVGLDFSWSDKAESEDSHKVGNRFIDGIKGTHKVYIDAVKLIGAPSQYEGPEDEVREPENGTPDSGR